MRIICLNYSVLQSVITFNVLAAAAASARPRESYKHTHTHTCHFQCMTTVNCALGDKIKWNKKRLRKLMANRGWRCKCRWMSLYTRNIATRVWLLMYVYIVERWSRERERERSSGFAAAHLPFDLFATFYPPLSRCCDSERATSCAIHFHTRGLKAGHSGYGNDPHSNDI